MTVSLPVAAIRQYARDVGMNEGFMQQHQDMIESFALRVATAQKKKDQQAVRAWYFNKAMNKPQLFELLESA